MHPTLYRPALVLTTALAASLHLLGCASGNAADAPPLRLDASSWVVAALRGSALVTGQTVTLRFEQGRVTGSDGCNRYSAAYRQDGPAGLSIDPSTQISTQMACPPPVEQLASLRAMLNLTLIRSMATARIWPLWRHRPPALPAASGR